MTKRPSLIKVAGATGLTVGLAIGGYSFASAASSSGTAPSTGSASAPTPARTRPGLAAAAKALGMSEADLQGELQSGKTIAAVAAEHNVDVNKVIDAMVADSQPALRKRIEAEVNGPVRRMRPGAGFANLGVAAGVIGISPTDLQSALKGGQSLAQVARSKNVDPQKVIDALVKDQTDKLDQAVKDGKITQSQEDQLKANLPKRVSDQVNGTPGHRGFGRRGAGPGGPLTPNGAGSSGAASAGLAPPA